MMLVVVGVCSQIERNWVETIVPDWAMNPRGALPATCFPFQPQMRLKAMDSTKCIREILGNEICLLNGAFCILVTAVSG